MANTLPFMSSIFAILDAAVAVAEVVEARVLPDDRSAELALPVEIPSFPGRAPYTRCCHGRGRPIESALLRVFKL